MNEAHTSTNTRDYDKHTENQLCKIHVTSLSTGISYGDNLISQELFNSVLYFLLLSIYHLLMRILIEWKDEFVNLFDVLKGRGSIRSYISLSLVLGHAIHLLQIKELCCY